MIQEYRTLLIKDLCARLPYNVKCYYQFTEKDCTIVGIWGVESVRIEDSIGRGKWETVEVIKPYLRPLSSMTDDEEKEVEKMWGWHYDRQANAIFNEDINNPDDYGGYHLFFVCEEDAEQLIDWLNEHHFDYRGLIGKSLALEAPKGMYNV